MLNEKRCAFYEKWNNSVYLIAEKDDAPGSLLNGLILIFPSLIIAFFALVLQKLLVVVLEF